MNVRTELFVVLKRAGHGLFDKLNRDNSSGLVLPGDDMIREAQADAVLRWIKRQPGGREFLTGVKRSGDKRK